MVYPLTCLTLFIIVALLFAVAWFFWPRVQHARLMQSPEQRRAALHAQRERELELLQQEMRIEEAAARIEERRAKTEQFRSVVRLGKGESAFTVDGQFFHAEKPMLLDPPHQQQAAEPVDPLPLLLDALHLMIIGFTGGGKTTLMHHLATTWAQSQRVMVLDFDYANGMWSGADVFTENRVEEFCKLLIDEFKSRKQQRQRGERTRFDTWRVVIDEYSAVADDKSVRSIVELLLRRGRKYRLCVVVGIQDNQVKSLGWEGKGALRSNFSYTVEAQKDPATGQRTLTLTPNDGEPITAATPQLPDPEAAVKPVPDRSKGVPHPERPGTGTPAERLPERYEGRDLEIAEAILRGWSKTKTRRSVTGRAADIGNRYDEIKAELEAQPPATEPAAKRPVIFVKPDQESREVLH